MGFIFGGNTGETPESLKKKREMADMLAMSIRAPKNVGEGLGAVGNALAYRAITGRANKAEARGRAGASSAFDNVLRALTGGNNAGASAEGFDPSNPFGAPAAEATTDYPSQRVSQAFGDPSLKTGIQQSAEALGISPVDLATAISYETGGTFDPLKKGPTTQWGQHRGLIQFGEPQARENGVDWNNPIQSQLGPKGAVVNYLKNAGVKPGMGLLDVYSAINAGAPGLYNRSDANNGGAPGTVRDKVEQQMADHRAKAMAMFGDEAKASFGGPYDPKPAMMNPSIVADAARGAQEGQQYIRGGGQPMPSQQPVQVAQAGNGPFPPAPSKPGSMQDVMSTAGNPWLTPGQQSILGMLMKQQQEQADPMRQLQMQKLQRELQQPTKRDTVTINGRLVDAQTGQEIANFPDATKPPTVQSIYDPKTGMEKKVQWNPQTGSWEDIGGVKAPSGTQLHVDPTTGEVTFQQGSGLKPLTEGQAKDTVFATRAEGSLPTLNKYENALTNPGGAMASSIPGGNYLKPEEYQKAEQAGLEFLQAILRKDTGAAITPQETAEYGRVYLPQPGDGPEVIAQKRASRDRAVAALKAGMPPQAILATEKALASQPSAPAQPAPSPVSPVEPPQPGTVMGGYRFKGGDPADKNNWEVVQ